MQTIQSDASSNPRLLGAYLNEQRWVEYMSFYQRCPLLRLVYLFSLLLNRPDEGQTSAMPKTAFA